MNGRTQAVRCGVCALGVALAALLAAPAAAAPLLAPRLESTESFSESFTVIADLESGDYLQLQLAVSNLGVGDGKGACRLLWVPPGGPPRTAATLLERQDWQHQPGPPERLQMGRCHLTAGEALAIHVEAEELVIDLTLQAAPRAHRPPDGELRTAKGFYESDILVPWADAIGTLRAGESSRALRGRGFSDHSRSTLMPGDTARQVARFRGVADARPLLVHARFAPDGTVHGWLWRHGQAAPVPLDTATLSRIGAGSESWEVRAEGGGEQPRLLSRQLLFRYAPVEQHGFLGRLARPVVGNPVTMTFRGVAQGLTGQMSIKGILEVTLNQGE